MPVRHIVRLHLDKVRAGADAKRMERKVKLEQIPFRQVQRGMRVQAAQQGPQTLEEHPAIPFVSCRRAAASRILTISTARRLERYPAKLIHLRRRDFAVWAGARRSP